MGMIGNAPAQGLFDSGNIKDGGVATIDIADAAVTTAKIADANVTTAKVADGAITSAKIADGAVATADIADGAVTGVKLAGSTIPVSKLTSGAPSWASDGTLTIAAPGGNGTAPLQLSSSSNATWNWATSHYAANTPSGGANVHMLGKDIGTNNSGYFGHRWSSNNSTANHMTIGMMNNDNLLNIYGTGKVVAPSGVYRGKGFVPDDKSGSSTHGYVEWNDNVTSQSFTVAGGTYTIGSVSFTIPATEGVTKWRVIASGSWTGATAGNRVWTNLNLDSTSSTIDGGSTGGHEAGWAESDISVPAHSFVSTTSWDVISSGSHTVRLLGYFNNNGTTCWRRGIQVWWFPES